MDDDEEDSRNNTNRLRPNNNNNINLNNNNLFNAPSSILPRFPDDFSFGTATAAFQIEGAWNIDGKGPSIWDTFVHTYPNRIRDQTNADVGPDSYHFYDKDIAAMKSLGVSEPFVKYT